MWFQTLFAENETKKIERDDHFAFLSLFTLVNKHQKQTNTTIMDPTSDPLDVAVALAQAMGPTDTSGSGGGDTTMPASDPTTPNKDKLLGGLMSPQDALLSASNHHLNVPMFTTTTCNDTSPPQQPQQPQQQSELVDPLDTNSCLSLLQTSVNPQSQPNINNTSAGIPSSFGLSFDKAWQMPLGWQQSNAAAAATPNHGITSAGIFFPPTPPVESPATGNHHQHSSSLAFTQQQQFPPPWLGMTPSSHPNGIPSTHNNTTTTLGKQQHQSPSEMNPLDMSSFWPFPHPTAPQPNMNRSNRHSIAIGSNIVDNSSNAITKPSTGRRKSTPARTYRRRTSSQPSVASVVSLSAHEPVAHSINGIEHITFLYSHDRLVKEYTVRTDAANCPLEDIPLDFRMVNAVCCLISSSFYLRIHMAHVMIHIDLSTSQCGQGRI